MRRRFAAELWPAQIRWAFAVLLRLRDERADYLRFTTDLAVSATNNQAERDPGLIDSTDTQGT